MVVDGSAAAPRVVGGLAGAIEKGPALEVVVVFAAAAES